MADVQEVRVPHDNVNDDAVFLRVWRVADGDRVEAEQPLAEVETSKAAYDIPSPASGVIKLVVSDECEVPVGSVLAYVGEASEAIATFLAARTEPIQRRLDASHAKPVSRTETPAVVQASVVTAESPATVIQPLVTTTAPAGNSAMTIGNESALSTRFSRRARELLQQRGLSESDFTQRGLIRACDIEARFRQPTETPAADGPHPAVRGAAGVPVRSEPVPRIKRLEARLLSWSTQQALRSSVITSVPAPPSSTDDSGDSAEWQSVRLIHEVASLLKKFPAFNGFCSGDQNHIYDQINVGYALDAGHGLKVPVFRNADAKSLEDLLSERRRFVDEYLADSLKPESLAGGTFTISDLSGCGIASFEPLIVEAQAAILGVGAKHNTGPGQTEFNLILSFDHRLIEGRAAARFINELKERLVESDSRMSAIERDLPHCSICRLTVTEAATRKHFLVPVAGESVGQSKLVCTICLDGR